LIEIYGEAPDQILGRACNYDKFQCLNRFYKRLIKNAPSYNGVREAV